MGCIQCRNVKILFKEQKVYKFKYGSKDGSFVCGVEKQKRENKKDKKKKKNSPPLLPPIVTFAFVFSLNLL
jgi:hypothetical protein